MGDEFVEIWSECQRQIKGGFFDRLKGPENKNMRRMFICLIVALVSTFGWPLAAYYSCILGQIISGLAIVVSSTFMVIYSKRLQKKDPFVRFSLQRAEAIKSVRIFLKETKIKSSNLDKVSKIVEKYCKDRKNDYRTFTNRAFSLCMSGVFIAGINAFFAAGMQSDPQVMNMSILICLIAIEVTPLACALWEIYDNCRKASLLKAEAMLRTLECYMTI